MKINIRILVVGLFVLLLIASFQIGSGFYSRTSLTEKPQGAPFTLQGSKGSFTLQEMPDDQLALIYFGYTWCPDICPTSMTFLSQAMQNLPQALAQKVQPIFISVDPDRDTPERLQSYVDFFEANILGLTGPEKKLEALAKKYGAFFRKVEMDSAMGYAIDHTSEYYLTDNQGKLLKTLPHSTSSGQMQEALLTALKQQP